MQALAHTPALEPSALAACNHRRLALSTTVTPVHRWGQHSSTGSRVCCAAASVDRASAPVMSGHEQAEAVAAASTSGAAEPAAAKPITIGANTLLPAAGEALAQQLLGNGRAAVWATGAANHYGALCTLAHAQAALQQQGRALRAVGAWQATDFEPDATKRRLRKLSLSVELAPADSDVLSALAPAAPYSLADGSGGGGAAALGPARVSTTRERDAAALCDALLAAIKAAAPGATALVFEARGEQAACKALKAVLGVQHVHKQWLVLLPTWGQVADVVADKRGESRTVTGLVLGVALPQ